MCARPLRILGWLAGGLLAALSGHASEPKIRHLEPARLEAIRAAFQSDVTAGGDPFASWFGTVAICAPRLWAQLKDTIDRYHIELIPAKFEVGSGMVIRGAAGNRDLAEALIPLVDGGVVRVPTDREYKRYWAIFPFDQIEEPVFMVTTHDGELLVHLQPDAKSGRYFVFLVEVFRP
jgi:hypothetical protein